MDHLDRHRLRDGVDAMMLARMGAAPETESPSGNGYASSRRIRRATSTTKSPHTEFLTLPPSQEHHGHGRARPRPQLDDRLVLFGSADEVVADLLSSGADARAEPRAPDVVDVRVGKRRRAAAGEHRLGPERLARALPESGEEPGQKSPLRDAASRTSTALSGVNVRSVTATVPAVSSTYRRPAQVSPTVHAGPDTAGTSTAIDSRTLRRSLAIASCLMAVSSPPEDAAPSRAVTSTPRLPLHRRQPRP